MPKLKTHRGAAKRFKVTSGGKIKHRNANRNHILTKKSSKRKRNLRSGDQYLAAVDERAVKRLLTIQ